MHVALTELLRCPRCGGDLVLLTERALAGRALDGTLGCAGCGGRFAVRAGVADVRPNPEAAGEAEASGPAGGGPAGQAVGSEAGPERGPADGPAPGGSGAGSADEALRLAALLGLEDARGAVLLVGTAGLHARGVAELASGVEAVPVAAAEPPAGWSADLSRDRVSPLLTGPRLPIADRRIAGVALPDGSHVQLAEAVRVLAPGRRLVVTAATPATEAAIATLDCRVVAQAEGVVVVERTGAPDPPRLYQLG